MLEFFGFCYGLVEFVCEGFDEVIYEEVVNGNNCIIYEKLYENVVLCWVYELWDKGEYEEDYFGIVEVYKIFLLKSLCWG